MLIHINIADNNSVFQWVFSEARARVGLSGMMLLPGFATLYNVSSYRMEFSDHGQ